MFNATSHAKRVSTNSGLIQYMLFYLIQEEWIKKIKDLIIVHKEGIIEQCVILYFTKQ